jgi:hypothetical protein
VITLGLQRKTAGRAKRPQPKLDLFLSLCQHVAAFMAEHDGGNFKAFFAHKGSGALGLYLMTDAEAYDFELSEKFAEYVTPYVERGLLDSVALVPKSTPEELGAYFDLETAFRVEINHA